MRRALNPCPRPSRRRQRSCSASTASSCKGIRSSLRSHRRRRSRWRTCWTVWRTAIWPDYRRRSPSPVAQPLCRKKNLLRGRPSRPRSRHRRRTVRSRSRLRPGPPAQPPGKKRCIKSRWLWRDRGRLWHIRILTLDGKLKCPPACSPATTRTVLRNWSNCRARSWGNWRRPVWHWRMRSSQNSLKSRPNG